MVEGGAVLFFMNLNNVMKLEIVRNQVQYSEEGTPFYKCSAISGYRKIDDKRHD